MKLNEIAAKLNIPVEQLLEQLEIEGVGKFSEVATRAGKTSELEATLAQKQQALAQYEQQIQQLQQTAQQTYQQTGQTPEWYNDAVLAPIAESYKQLQAQVNELQEKKFAALASGFQQFIDISTSWANKMELRELKRQYPDFDTQKVQAYAQAHGINDWEAAYNAERATRLPDIIKAEVEKARQEGMQRGVQGAPVPTEMGSINPAPLADTSPKDYAQGWKQMLADLQGVGMGGH